jgi:serine/threonine protein kinase
MSTSPSTCGSAAGSRSRCCATSWRCGRHTNIVQLEDLIEADGGPPCLVMELLTGRSLRDVLRSQRALDAAGTIDIGVQICGALEAIHALGVLHRDLTPCNIFLCDMPGDDAVDGSTCVKLLDFGVAKLLSNDPPGTDSGEHVTAEGAIIGTPGYMSPEQASGGTIDARSDLYSLGVLLYELVSGEPLVTGKTFGECVRAHIADTPRPLHTTERGRNAPPALAALVMRCLAKRADQRPASAADLRRALLAVGTPAAPRPSRRQRIWILALATVATVSIAARAASWPSQPDRSPAPGTTAPTQVQQCSIPADESSSRSPAP